MVRNYTPMGLLILNNDIIGLYLVVLAIHHRVGLSFMPIVRIVTTLFIESIVLIDGPIEKTPMSLSDSMGGLIRKPTKNCV